MVPMQNIKAEVAIKFDDSRTAEIFFHALQPESLNDLTDRSSVLMEQVNDSIRFVIAAKDITAFRATLNSYLIWMRMLLSISSL
jgi:tRNA threonylcarbamoyladenosine modification (KEOPS) complex  Pcc1 subunit